MQPHSWDAFPDNLSVNKDKVFNAIKELSGHSLNSRQEAWCQSLLSTTFLGKLFYYQRKLKKPSVENKNGTLYKIAAALQAELSVPDAKIMLSDTTKKALNEDIELQRSLQKNFSDLHQKLVDADILPLKPQKISSEVKSESKMEDAEPRKTASAPPALVGDTAEQIKVFKPSAPLFALSPLTVSSDLKLENNRENKKEEKQYTRIADLLKQSEKQKCDLSDVPDKYRCPISQEIMLDPVIAADGYHYDFQQINKWMKSKEQECKKSNKPVIILSPKENLKLEHLYLTVSKDYRGEIVEYLQQKLKEKQKREMGNWMFSATASQISDGDSRSLVQQFTAMPVPTHIPKEPDRGSIRLTKLA